MTRVGTFSMRPEPTQSLFTALLRSIVYQQLSGKAAATILGRVNRLFARRRFPTPGELLEVSPARLREAGLSTAKTAAVRDLAARTLDGTVPSLARIRRMEDEIIERLTIVRGIGRWTAEMLLIFRLGRPDVLPLNDLGVRKGFGMTFRTRKQLPEPSVMARRGECWRPYRSVASWYLWRALEL
jgi:3-methyladenine DNA glycosylase/8-oxoguanine DNA glycosylase